LPNELVERGIGQFEHCNDIDARKAVPDRSASALIALEKLGILGDTRV
jgi:hypothetical protein